jgi:hypothetical protein
MRRLHRLGIYTLASLLFLSCLKPTDDDSNRIRKETSPFVGYTWFYSFTKVNYINDDSTWYIGTTSSNWYTFDIDQMVWREYMFIGEHCPQNPNLTVETTLVADSALPIDSFHCVGFWGRHIDSTFGTWDFNDSFLFITFNLITHEYAYRFSADEDTFYLQDSTDKRALVKIKLADPPLRLLDNSAF